MADDADAAHVLLRLVKSTFDRLVAADSRVSPLIWIEDVHTCSPVFFKALSAALLNEGLYNSYPIIMTASELSEEFLENIRHSTCVVFFVRHLLSF